MPQHEVLMINALALKVHCRGQNQNLQGAYFDYYYEEFVDDMKIIFGLGVACKMQMLRLGGRRSPTPACGEIQLKCPRVGATQRKEITTSTYKVHYICSFLNDWAHNHALTISSSRKGNSLGW